MSINTTECCYYNSDNKEFPCDLYDNECEAQFCYFQQLQQVKADNEELKKQLIQKDEVNTFFNTLDLNNDPCEICSLKNCLDDIEKYCEEQNLKYDTTACDVLRKIQEIKR